jgi:hypothetical protein
MNFFEENEIDVHTTYKLFRVTYENPKWIDNSKSRRRHSTHKKKEDT